MFTYDSNRNPADPGVYEGSGNSGGCDYNNDDEDCYDDYESNSDYEGSGSGDYDPEFDGSRETKYKDRHHSR